MKGLAVAPPLGDTSEAATWGRGESSTKARRRKTSRGGVAAITGLWRDICVPKKSTKAGLSRRGDKQSALQLFVLMRDNSFVLTLKQGFSQLDQVKWRRDKSQFQPK